MDTSVSVTAVMVWDKPADNIAAASVSWCDSFLDNPSPADITNKTLCIPTPSEREEQTAISCIIQELYDRIRKSGTRTATLCIRRPDKTQPCLPADIQIRGFKLHLEDYSLVVTDGKVQTLFNHALDALKTI